jgi:drug/metabolite transporter (DMT)-like permease
MSGTGMMAARSEGAAREQAAGVACMVGAMALLPMGDSVAKLLTGVIDPLEVTMWRLFAQVACLGLVALFLRHRLHGRMFSPVVAFSGALVCAMLGSLITAFSVMPIATAISIFFVEPLLLTLLAWPFLGERPGPRRLLGVAVGLLGALIVIRPGFSVYGWVTLLPLVAALAFALNMILLRRATAVRSGLTLQLGASIYAAGLMAAGVLGAAALGWGEVAPSAMPGWTWGAVAAAGVLAAASFLLIAEAFRRVEAGILAPFQYLEIVGATAVGYLVFGDLPDALTWLGVAIILGSGLYVYRRERIAAAPPPRRQAGR